MRTVIHEPDTRCGRHRNDLLEWLRSISGRAGYFVSIGRGLDYGAEGIDALLPEDLKSGHLHRGHLESSEPASFDIVTLPSVVGHLVEPRPLFTEIRRVFRPSGVPPLTGPYGGSLACRIHREHWAHMVLEEHLSFWTLPAITRMLRSLDFYRAGRCSPGLDGG